MITYLYQENITNNVVTVHILLRLMVSNTVQPLRTIHYPSRATKLGCSAEHYTLMLITSSEGGEGEEWSYLCSSAQHQRKMGFKTIEIFTLD